MFHRSELSALPDLILEKIQVTSDSKHLVASAMRFYSLFQQERLNDQFLRCVARGQQKQAEILLASIIAGNEAKIQAVLCYCGTVTDYSHRTFHCSAYEYAYWAKDTKMCRMLTHYMNQDTKALILARIETLEASGLIYHQHGVAYQCAHFDYQPLYSSLSAIAFHANIPFDIPENRYLAEEMVRQLERAKLELPEHALLGYGDPDGPFDRSSMPWDLQWGRAKADLKAMMNLEKKETLELKELKKNLVLETGLSVAAAV